MKIDILTIFPNMFSGPFSESIIKRAINKSQVAINIHNLRKWTTDKHQSVDDRPYGGGAGMIMKCEPVFKAVNELKKTDTKIVLASPQGETFNQDTAKNLSKNEHLIFICPHYEGVDERIRENLVDLEISIGDFILTGGELPTMVIVDSLVRLLPGVLKKEEALEQESFEQADYKGRKVKLLEFPQYTRPENFRGFKVPNILLTGNHKLIEKWKKEKSIEITKQKRPDLLK